MTERVRSLSPPWIPDSAAAAKPKAAKGSAKKSTKTAVTAKTAFGVLGERKDLTKQQIEDILNVIREDIPTITKINLPADSISSIYIESWADRNKIEVDTFSINWKDHGRASRAIRDKQIEQNSSNFLIFVGPRSQHYRQVADRIVNTRGGSIYIQPHKITEPIELLITEDEDLEKPLCPEPSKHDRTSNRKRGRSQKQEHQQSSIVDYFQQA